MNIGLTNVILELPWNPDASPGRGCRGSWQSDNERRQRERKLRLLDCTLQHLAGRRGVSWTFLDLLGS
jgi:hypothetical protein